MKADRLALLLALATLLFAGALRSFLSAVYYDNLVALELGPSALWSLALLSPALFLLPALRRRPHAVLVAAALGLALGRALLAPTRGTPLHLPFAALAAASWPVLLGALVPLARGPVWSAAAAGVGIGLALDIALLWLGDSSDPTATLAGLALVLPAGAFLAWLAWTTPREPAAPAPARRAPAPALAALALGAWLFLANTLAANPYGAARWNGADPGVAALAGVAGLLVGALLVQRVARWSPAALAALHAVALLALVDHALLHTPAFPLLLAALAATLVVDLALLLPHLGMRTLALAGLVALLLHFLYAFTFLFAFVPLGSLWKGQAPTIYLVAGLILAGLAWLAAPAPPPVAPAERQRATRLLLAPAIVALFAAVSADAAILPPDPEGDGAIRVLSFNVHQGFSNAGVVDPEVFLRVLAEADADVVVLQEADTPRFTSAHLDVGTYLAQRGGYHHVYGQPTREQAFGGAILSRYPILEWQAVPLPSPSDNRWYTEALLDVNGTRVWIYAIHLALPHEARIPQMDAILLQAATREGPKLLVGDLNSCPSGLCPSYDEGVADDVYAKATTRYQDTWTAAGGARDDPAALTYDASAPSERIDYILASPDIRVVDARVMRTPAALAASDHLPVLADVVV